MGDVVGLDGKKIENQTPEDKREGRAMRARFDRALLSGGPYLLACVHDKGTCQIGRNPLQIGPKVFQNGHQRHKGTHNCPVKTQTNSAG